MSDHKRKTKNLRCVYSKSKLAKLHERRITKEKQQLRGEYQSAENGSNQIRSYVFFLHPYKMVKDHRTDVETADPEKFLMVILMRLLRATLEWKGKHDVQRINGIKMLNGLTLFVGCL